MTNKVGSMKSLNRETENQPRWIDQPLDDRFICVFCKSYLRSPVQFELCEHRVCSKCLKEILRGDCRCPNCQSSVKKESSAVDEELQTEIFNLEVFCSNQEKGCSWGGAFRDLTNHLDECLFVEIECGKNCFSKFERRFKEKHEKGECPKRRVKCEFCSTEFLAENEIEHLTVCSKFLVPCPNRCTDSDFRRTDLEKHLKEECPRQELNCPFSECGCEFRGLRQAITEHVKVSAGMHLNFAGKSLAIQKASIEALTEKLNEQRNWIDLTTKKINSLEKNYGAAYIWRIDRYQERLQEARSNRKTTLFSPVFPISRYGYRMSLSICLCGDGRAKGKYVSLFACICRGDYDSLLNWPFCHQVTFTMIDQSLDIQNRRNISYSVKPNVCRENRPFLGRPITERNASFGVQKFTTLESMTTLDYVRNDELFIKFEVDNQNMDFI